MVSEFPDTPTLDTCDSCGKGVKAYWKTLTGLAFCYHHYNKHKAALAEQNVLASPLPQIEEYLRWLAREKSDVKA